MSRSTSRDFRHRQSRPASETQPHVDIVVDGNAFERRDGQLADDRTIGFLERAYVDGHERASYARDPSGRKRVVAASPAARLRLARPPSVERIASSGSADTMYVPAESLEASARRPIALRSGHRELAKSSQPSHIPAHTAGLSSTSPAGGWDGWVRCSDLRTDVSSAGARKAAAR